MRKTMMMGLFAILGVVLGLAPLAGQPQSGPGVFDRVYATIAATVGTTTLTDPSVQELDVRSNADGLSGGIRISRADANSAYLILNMDDASSFATIQAGDSVASLPTKLSPNGGGVSVGTGAAFINVLTGTTTWDPLSIADTDAAVNTVTVTGVTTLSTCFASFSSLTTTAVAITAQASSANTVAVTLTNNSGSAHDFGSGTLRAVCFTY